jgi:hypothetical protein
MAQCCSEELLFDVRLVLLTPLLFAETLTREGFFGPTSFPGLHIVTVLLDFLNDVFRLYLTFESSERILQRLTLLNDNLCHAYSPPFPFWILNTTVGFLPVYRFTAKPAIVHFFYRRLSHKSRLKLYKCEVRAVHYSLVIQSAPFPGSPPPAEFWLGCLPHAHLPTQG